MFTTVVADAILSALGREARAVAALEIKAHVLDLKGRAKLEPGLNPDEEQARDMLQSFFERLTEQRAA